MKIRGSKLHFCQMNYWPYRGHLPLSLVHFFPSFSAALLFPSSSPSLIATISKPIVHHQLSALTSSSSSPISDRAQQQPDGAARTVGRRQ